MDGCGGVGMGSVVDSPTTMISMGCEMADAPLRLTIRGVSSGNRSLSRVDLLIAGDDNIEFIHLQEIFTKSLCVLVILSSRFDPMGRTTTNHDRLCVLPRRGGFQMADILHGYFPSGSQYFVILLQC